jgi:hypothetical protein
LTYKSALSVLILVFFAGCASVPVNSREILEFTIKPDKGIKSGSFILVVVKTTDIVEKVSGSLDVMGSPKFPLRYDAKKKAWIFAYVIPVTMQVPKGEFLVKLEATGKNGEKFTAEKKISTY